MATSRVPPLALAGIWLLGSAFAAEWHAAPVGGAANRGSLESPWDVPSVAAGEHPEVKPGDTVWLAGGRYAEKADEEAAHKRGFYFTLSGQPPEEKQEQKPIIFRAMAGERVIIDKCVYVAGHDLWCLGVLVVNWPATALGP